MSYLGVPPFGQTVRTITESLATAGQTTFSPSGGYLPGYIDVFLNGSALGAADFTATDGSTVVLNVAAALNDEFKAIAYWPVSLIDTYRKAEADAAFLPKLNPSYTGTLTGGTGVVNLGSGQFYKDASGNVGIGITPSAWASAWKVLQNQGGFLGANGTSSLRIGSNSYSDGTNWRYINNGSAAAYQILDNTHSWSIAASGTAGNAISFTQAMTLDSSGNLLVGTTTPYAPAGSGQLRVNGFISSSKTGIPGASNNEVMIGGNAGSPTAGRVFFGDNTGWQWDWGYVNSGGTYGVRFRFTDQGSAFNTSGTWGTISDARLKENIVDATPKLDGLLRLRVRNFNFITEPDKKQIGFVAQEVEEIFPGLVDNTKPDADGNSTKAVKTTVLVPMLVKAIQEQQAIIEQLKADVATLKAAA